MSNAAVTPHVTSAAAPDPAGDNPWANDTKVLADIRTIARGPLEKAARRIDQEGHYPADLLAELGRAGAFACHLDRYGTRFDLALANMREISSVCGATGFMTWCQNVCGLYMEQSRNPALLDRLPEHAAGLNLGGTGLSNPMKALTGIEKMALQATRVDGGYLVNGTLPWVSNIDQGHCFGAIASVAGEDGTPCGEIMFLLDIDERVKLRPCREFSGMEGTSTWCVPLVDYLVDDSLLIADPARPFVKTIRGAFVLLQVGMASGVIQGAIESIRAVEPALGHVNRYLDDRPDELQEELDTLTARAAGLAQTPYDESTEFFLEVLDVRVKGAELSLKASQSALLHQGARGYLMRAAPQRRIREAHFVAIVTPAIKHLRWEMDKLRQQA